MPRAIADPEVCAEMIEVVSPQLRESATRELLRAQHGCLEGRQTDILECTLHETRVETRVVSDERRRTGPLEPTAKTLERKMRVRCVGHHGVVDTGQIGDRA